MKGKLITFEGCEGVGKSTQVRLLKEYLQRTNQNALFLREPGGTKISEQIREIILSTNNSEMSDTCEVMLYSAARAQLIDQVILPELNKGRDVICDRYIDSTTAYQGFARGLGVDFVSKLNRLIYKNCYPDATVFLDLDPSLAFKRKGGADGGDRLEMEEMGFHKKVYEGYKRAVAAEPDRFIVIKPTGTKFETNAAIIEQLKIRGIII